MSESVAIEKIVYAEREPTTSSHEIGELTRVSTQMNVASQLLERILCTSFERIRVGIARAQHTQVSDTQLDILSFMRTRHDHALAFNSRVEMQRVKVVAGVRFERVSEKDQLKVTRVGTVVEMREFDLFLIARTLDPTDHADSSLFQRFGTLQKLFHRPSLNMPMNNTCRSRLEC